MVDNATLAKLQEKKKSEVVPEEKPWYHHSKVRRYRYGGPLRVGLDIFVPLYWFRPLGNYKPVVTMSSCVYLGGYRYYDNPQDVTRQTFFLYDWEETSLPFDYAMVLSDGELSTYFWQQEYGSIDKSRFGGKKFHGVVLNVKDDEVTLACDDFVYDFPLAYFDHPVLPLQCVTFTISDYNQAITGGNFAIRDMTIWEVAHEQITQMPFLSNTAFNFAIAARNLLKNKANLKRIANERKRNRINKKKEKNGEEKDEEIKDGEEKDEEVKENPKKDENDQKTETQSDKKETAKKEVVEKTATNEKEKDKNKNEKNKGEDVKNDQKEIDQKKGKDQKKESDKKNYQKKENYQKMEAKTDKNKTDKNKTDKNKVKDISKDDQKKSNDQKNEIKEKEVSKNVDEEEPTEQEKAIMMDVTKQLLEKLNIGIKRDSETPVKEDTPVEKETDKGTSVKEAAVSATDTDPEAPKDKKKPPKPKRPRKPREKKDSTKSQEGESSNKETSPSPKKTPAKEEPLSIKDLSENTKTEGNEENNNSNSSDKNRTDESVDGSPKKKQQRRRPRRRRSQKEGNEQKTEVVAKENQGENKPSQD